MPWSCAEGMKWVAISPLVDAPQIAKPIARAQKVRVRAASTRVVTARRAGPAVAPIPRMDGRKELAGLSTGGSAGVSGAP
jgi:hypothetical protein